MKRTLLFAVLFVCCSAVFAQSDGDIHKREIQVEIGEATQMIIGQSVIDVPGVPKRRSHMLNVSSSPAISITYHQNINGKFWYGVSASFKQKFFFIYPTYTGKRGSLEANNIFALMPALKFAYYNSERLQMYSELQFGFSVSTGKTVYNDTNTEDRNATVGLFGQLTGFGIRYGKDFFIGTELGYGSKGIINFVAGYKF